MFGEGMGGIMDTPHSNRASPDKLLDRVVPPFAQVPKFGGPVYQNSSKDYGNFVDSKRIDEIIKNVRQLR